MELTANEKKSVIDAIIDNSLTWSAEDRTILEGLKDEKLILMRDEAFLTSNSELNLDPDQTPAPTAPKTEAEWLADAPESVRTVFNESRRIVDAKKATIIENMTSQIEDGARKETVTKVLMTKDLSELELLASLPAFTTSAQVTNATSVAPSSPVGTGGASASSPAPGSSPAPLYNGRAAVPVQTPVSNQIPEEDDGPLVPPVMNHREIAREEGRTYLLN